MKTRTAKGSNDTVPGHVGIKTFGIRHQICLEPVQSKHTALP